MPVPPGGRQTPDEGEGGASDELRSAMDAMKVGGDEIDRGEEAEVEQDDAAVEGGGGRGGICWHWKLQGF